MISAKLNSTGHSRDAVRVNVASGLAPSDESVAVESSFDELERANNSTADRMQAYCLKTLVVTIYTGRTCRGMRGRSPELPHL